MDLNLGHQEEGKVTQFQVDCTEWLDKWPGAVQTWVDAAYARLALVKDGEQGPQGEQGIQGIRGL